MARRLLLELIGDPENLLRSLKRSSAAADSFGRDLKQVGITARQSAEAQVQASVKKDARLRSEITSYRAIASAAKRGSQEQVIAARLGAEAQARLARSLGVTARESRSLAASAERAQRSFGRAGRGALAGSGAFRAAGRSIAFASAGFISFAAAAQGLRASITAASDLTEEINKSTVVFRGSEKQVQSWSEHLLPAFGLTRAEALKTAASFGNMLVPMGFVRQRAAEMSERLVALAGDMASFNNASPADTLRALQAGLAGQVRPLRQFGVFLSQDRIAAEALSSGIVKANVNIGKVADAQTKIAIAQARLSQERKKFGANSIEAASAETSLHAAERALGKELQGNVPKLTTAQKTLATYRIILKDTADAHGDASRTGKEFAGQLRAEHAEVGNLKEQIGALLLPTVRQYLTEGNKWLSQSKNQQAVLRTVKDAVQIFKGAVAGTVTVLRPMARVARSVAEAVGGWRNAFAIITSLYLANKFLTLAKSIRASELAAGRLRSAVLGLRGLTVAIGIDLIINKDDRNALIKFIKGDPGSTQNKALHDLIHVGQGIADAATQIAKGNVGHSGHTLGFNKPAPSPGLPAGRSPEDVHPGIHSTTQIRRKAAQDEETSAKQDAQTAAKRRRISQLRAQTDFMLPFRFQLAEAKAAASGIQAQAVKAARDIRAYLLAQIPHLKGQRLLTAYGLLASANQTIAAAVQAAAEKAKAAAEKVKQQIENLKQKIAALRDKFQQAVDNIRSQVGELFQGPILAPTDAQTKAKLGVPGPSAKTLTADLNAQVAEFRRFNKDLAILAKRGAPKELLKELRAKGPEALPEIEALAKASRQTLNAFFKAFGRRERLVQRVARVEMRATLVTMHADQLKIQALRGGGGGNETIVVHNHIDIDGKRVADTTTKHQVRKKRLITQQRRGGTAGQNPMGP